MSLIDTHCHLDAAEFDADRDEVVAAAKLGAGGTAVEVMVVPAVERANFGAVASVCRTYPGCAPSFGIHPMYVDRVRPEDLDALRETLQHQPAVAVGEIGLDRHVQPRDDGQQMFWFRSQLELARELGLPVLLHVRRAIDPILKALREIPVPGGIAHAFNGSREQAEQFIKLGFKLGFGGAMTYPGSKRIRALAATLPLEAIVLETDAPDIPPAWKPNGRNTPADLVPIAETLAQLRGMPLMEIAARTRANTLAVLPRLVNFIPHGEMP
ncbi:TatD family hydrolase [Sulfuricystis multivorans]|uniref:TatD family hydrolase n=1 Tax=Sulfuricystis multivorans TaxID=2211108 RepID=UPI0024DFAA9E|nr:TatD family hydrolase [Sulfuricystis multivorans]